MDDESVLLFDKNLENVEYDCAKDCNPKRTNSTIIDPGKHVDKISNLPLALLGDKIEGRI